MTQPNDVKEYQHIFIYINPQAIAPQKSIIRLNQKKKRAQKKQTVGKRPSIYPDEFIPLLSIHAHCPFSI